MNILVSGCSFTHWPEEPGSPNNICWPAALQTLEPTWQITNVAEPGAGNQYIANSVTTMITANPGKFDMVLVMWSGVSRLDFLTDLSDPSWHALFDSYGFYRRVENCPNQLGYIFSGGYIGPWTENAAAARVFNEMYKVSSNLSLAYTALTEIVKTQNFLQNQRIPYRFMSYVNYWNTLEHVSPNGDFGVYRFPELRPLITAIDFEPWIFRDVNRDGIYEMAREINDYHGDRFHPGRPTHGRWADIVRAKI
jgi:hypothetical protein